MKQAVKFTAITASLIVIMCNDLLLWWVSLKFSGIFCPRKTAIMLGVYFTQYQRDSPKLRRKCGEQAVTARDPIEASNFVSAL
jgi:hypothetical protein